MMDCDYKQALQKLDELRRHKDQLTEEVRHCCQGHDAIWDIRSASTKKLGKKK